VAGTVLSVLSFDLSEGVLNSGAEVLQRKQQLEHMK
jgi:hypothetical protein